MFVFVFTSVTSLSAALIWFWLVITLNGFDSSVSRS